MKMNITTWIIILVVIAGGWALLATDFTPPIAEITSSEESSVNVITTLSPKQPKAGEPTTINFSFTNPDGSPASDLMIHHARRVHAVFVSEDLGSIGHIHPEDFSVITDSAIESGNYTVTYTFPKAGKYIAGVDVMNSSGAIGKQFIINVKGSPKIEVASINDSRNEKCLRGYPEDGTDRYVKTVFTAESEVTCSDGYTVTFTTSVDQITAGEEVRLEYYVEKDGEPVTDLEPFLDAPLHLAIVPTTLSTLLHRHGVVAGIDHHEDEEVDHEEEIDTAGIHIMSNGSVMLGNGEVLEDAEVMSDGMIKLSNGETVEPTMDMREDGSMEDMEEADSHDHAEVPDAFGPDLVSEGITFPEAGKYQVFAQTKHDGQIIFSSFMVEVEESFKESESKVFDLEVSERDLSSEIVTVTEEDKVIFRISTDELGEFHIAGYEIAKDMELDGTTEIRFTAQLAGRYNLELHPEGSEEDVVIGALVVNPK